MSTTLKCACSETFTQESGLTRHQGSCKKHLDSVKNRLEAYKKALREESRRNEEARVLREEHERQANVIAATSIEEPLEVRWNP